MAQYAGSRLDQTTEIQTPRENGWIDRLMNPRADGRRLSGTEVLAAPQTSWPRQSGSRSGACPKIACAAKSAPRSRTLLDEEDALLNAIERQRILDEVLDEVFGLGPLEPLLLDPDHFRHPGHPPQAGLRGAQGQAASHARGVQGCGAPARIIEKIVSRVGRRIDESSPMVDARLPDGSRVNAVIPPVAVDGPMLSIRRFGKVALQSDDLVRSLTWTRRHGGTAARLAWRRGSTSWFRAGTGAGKTTILNVLSSPLFRRPSASSPSRTPPNCGCSRCTRRAWKPGPPISRATAPFTSASW